MYPRQRRKSREFEDLPLFKLESSSLLLSPPEYEDDETTPTHSTQVKSNQLTRIYVQNTESDRLSHMVLLQNLSTGLEGDEQTSPLVSKKIIRPQSTNNMGGKLPPEENKHMQRPTQSAVGTKGSNPPSNTLPADLASLSFTEKEILANSPLPKRKLSSLTNRLEQTSRILPADGLRAATVTLLKTHIHAISNYYR